MILITGAGGNVGREVVKQALAVGIKIALRSSRPQQQLKPLRD
jgi:uncharacterized protein YbjT (DUF2867 family)